MRTNRLQELWLENRSAVNCWLTIPSPITAEQVAHAGFDSVLIDMQHGPIGYETAIAMLQAISTTPTVPLVRPPWNEPGVLMRLLDAGAYGVICPMINTKADAEALVSACRYPPLGERSFGPFRAALYGGEDYVARANDTVVVFAMIETAMALANLEAIASVPGLSGLYIGPSDLSLSLGLQKRADFSDPRLDAALSQVLEVCRAHGLIAGMHSTSVDLARQHIARGFRLVTPMTDATALQAAAREAARRVRE